MDQQTKSKKLPPPTQDFDNLEAASFKKYNVDVNCLAKVGGGAVGGVGRGEAVGGAVAK